MDYGATHRVLLRALMSMGVLTLHEAKRLVREHAGDDDIAVNDMVKDINAQIRPFQQHIKTTTDELSDEKVLVFLSLGFDDITKSQNVFSPAELEYFRVLIEQIVTTERRQVTGIAALNLVSQLKVVLSKHDAERHLKTWCKMRYLDLTEGAYSLGIRAVHEFEGYMRRNMPDAVEECSLCKQIVFRGCNCPLCGVAVHTSCLNRYLERVQRWPCCSGVYAGLPDLADASQDMPGPSVSQVYEPDESADPTQDVTEDADAMEETAAENASQASMPGISQASALGISQTSAVRKRKRLRET